MPLYVRESGSAMAPTIVFLHGGGVSGWMWQPQVERFQDYHCLIPDLPEHGRSVAEKQFSIQGSAARIAELIRTRAHGGRVHVVGLSLGAQIAVQLLGTSPKSIDHAVVSSTLARPIPGAGTVNWMARMYMPFKNMGFLIRANMRQMGIPATYFEQFQEDTQRLTADSFAHITAENMSFRMPPGLNRATARVLVVAGQKEPKVMHEPARDLAAAIPNARACIATGLGHAWNLQAPDLFANTIRAWINDQPLPRELMPLR